MAKKRSPDFILLGICGLLVLAGVLVLASVSVSFSLQKTGTTFFFLGHQLVYGLVPGLALGTIAFFLPMAFIKKWSFAALLAAMFFLVLLFIPGIGGDVGGANRWLSLGPLSFQPAEPLKIAFILYAASWLSSRASSPSSRRQPFKETLVPFVAIMGTVSLLLIMQPDVSTLGVIATTGLAMYFLSGTPVWHSLFLLGAGFLALTFLTVAAPYRFSRLAVFLNPSLDPLGQGYQAKQALIAVGSGGVFGTGLGLSFQKFGTLPEPISDSIFAVFAEETGFIGSTLLIVLFLAFAWRAFGVARHSADLFCSLTAVGITFWIFAQATINIGSMVGLLPLTGIPLPFISYGGSALASELIALGILLNISKGSGTS